jgi:GNAT superfamily N-acetyltransferase
MEIVEKKDLSLKQKEALFQLWNNEYPEKLSYKNTDEFDMYLNSLSNTKHYLLIVDANEIKGWAFTFLREEEVWFAIIVDDQMQGKGKGSLLLEELKKGKNNLNGWVVDHDNDSKQNGEAYTSPLLFYIKNGFTICNGTRIENEKIAAVKINWIR